MSDGSEIGNDGDILIKRTVSGITNTNTLFRKTTITITSDYTINDVGTVFVNAGNGDLYVGMPASPIDGDHYYIKRIDSSGTSVTISGTIDGEWNEFLYASESLRLIWSSGSSSWYVI
jgi:hypothetical protein